MAGMIREDATVAALPLILATSAPSANLRSMANDVGIAYVLAKPVRQRILICHLQELVEQQRAVQRAPKASEARVRVTAETVLHILVVDDVVINQQVAAGMLTRLGHQVEVAGDGVAAIAKIKDFDFDLIFMDVQMPRMNGVEATTVIRALPGPKAAVPIIAMTASAMDGDRETLLTAGMNDYISKPFSLAQLTDVVEMWRQRLLENGVATERADTGQVRYSRDERSVHSV
jgi:two-component system sensor histidine kinase/response regulator